MARPVKYNTDPRPVVPFDRSIVSNKPIWEIEHFIRLLQRDHISYTNVYAWYRWIMTKDEWYIGYHIYPSGKEILL